MRTLTVPVRRWFVALVAIALSILLTAGACSGESAVSRRDISALATISALSCSDARSISNEVSRLANASAPGERAGLQSWGLDPDNASQLESARTALLERVKQADCVGATTPSANSSSSQDEKMAAAAEAQEWVRRLVTKFAGVTTIPDDCQKWQPVADLTVAEYYRDRPDKESATAFGPDWGNTPCAVSIKMVETAYRDPAFAVSTYTSLPGIPTGEVLANDQIVPHTVQLFGGPFADRRDLARKLLGWYTADGHTLTIQEKNEPYASNNMTGAAGSAPTVNGIAANKRSTVVVTTDASGAVVDGRRASCGGQFYAPLPPGFMVPEPGEEMLLQPKDPFEDPQQQGNNRMGGGGVAPAAPTTASAPSVSSPASTAVYTPPSTATATTAPGATPVPSRSTPPPPPPPSASPSATVVPSGTPTCDPKVCG